MDQARLSPTYALVLVLKRGTTKFCMVTHPGSGMFLEVSQVLIAKKAE